MKPTVFDASKFPPLIPSGQYRLDFTVYSNDLKVFDIHIYVAVLYSQLYNGPK